MLLTGALALHKSEACPMLAGVTCQIPAYSAGPAHVLEAA